MKKYIGKKEKLSFGLAAAASYLVAGIAQSYLMYFLTDILIVSYTFVLVLMIGARVWDAINDPIMGIVIDKSKFRSGKMRPYILIGSFFMAVTSILLFLPLTDLSSTAKMIYASVVYIAFGMSYTLVDVPAMGLMSVATPDSEERASLLSFYVTVGTIGGLMPIALLPVFELIVPAKWLYFSLATFTGILAFVAYFVLYRNSKERCSTKSQDISVKDIGKIVSKNKPMIQALLMSMIASPRYLMLPGLIYIATYVYVFGTLSSGMALMILYAIIGVGMFAGILLTPVMYTRWGYKKTAIFTGLVGGVGMTVAFLVGLGNLYVALPFMTIGGIGLGAYNVLPYPMVGDSLDYLEYETGERMEGMCFSLNSFVTKFNNAVGFVGLILGLIVVGYVAPETAAQSVVQSSSTVIGLFAMVTIVPGISFFLSIIPMLFYSFHGEKKERMLAELEVRRQAGDTSMVVED